MNPATFIHEMQISTADLPPIPAKRYFTIGEVSDLCGVKPHVLRYWEQEFTQLKPIKRRGNRRYYQHHEVLLVRRIRELLYEHGYTISGARNQLGESAPVAEKTINAKAKLNKTLEPVSEAHEGKELTVIASTEKRRLNDEPIAEVLTASTVRVELKKILGVLRP
jgi:DNA-binding transcriptional MerR regulator